VYQVRADPTVLGRSARHLDELVRHAGCSDAARAAVDELDLFQPLLARADASEARSAGATGAENTKVIRGALQAMGAFK